MTEGFGAGCCPATDVMVLHLPAEPSSLDQVAEAIETCSADGCWDPKDRYHVDLVIEELVQNIISYGFPEGCPGHFNLLIQQVNDDILIRLEDDGVAFNPFDIPGPDLESPLEERAIGGLGVYFAKTFMDAHCYRRVNGRNCVELRKRMTPAPSL